MAQHNTHRAPGRAVTPFPTPAGFGRGLGILSAGAVATAGLMIMPTSQADANQDVWDRVAHCESTGRWSINNGNGYYGGLQFSPSTWKEFGGQEFAPRADLATKSEQIAVAQRALAKQGPGAWPTCSKRAGLTKQNGGANPNAQPAGKAPVAKKAAAPAPAAKKPAPAPAPKKTAAPARKAGQLVVDGRFGPATTRSLQQWAGLRPTGTLTRSDIMAIQRKVGAKPDGIWGRETTAKLQRHIGMKQNGVRFFRSDAASVRALQTYLNQR